jgi:hypothetical protein
VHDEGGLVGEGVDSGFVAADVNDIDESPANAPGVLLRGPLLDSAA